MKRKHGAEWAKIYPSFAGAKKGFIGKRGYYIRC